MEDAVGAGGVFYCLVGLVLLPFLWALPQSLMTAELSTMMPENGGSYIWVWRALGETCGVVNAYSSLIVSLFDICLYPSLVAAYMPKRIGSVGKYVVKVVLLGSVSCFNALGLDFVGLISIFLLILTMSVFVAEIPFAVAHFTPQVWTMMPKTLDWGLMFSVLLWSNTGWDALGAIAGEVSNPSKTYPLGISLALLMSSCAYIIPIVVSYSVLPDPALWHSDAFFDAALSVAPWMAIWMRIACTCGSIGQLNAGIASTSRRIWAMACDADPMSTVTFRTLPSFMSQLSERFVTPINALIAQFIITAFLSLADFSFLIEFEMLLNCSCLLFEFAAFMVLKYKEPDAPRPYVVPFGRKGAWAITLVKTFVVAIILASMIWKSPFMVAIAVAMVALMAIAFKLVRNLGVIERFVTFDSDSNLVRPLV